MLYSLIVNKNMVKTALIYVNVSAVFNVIYYETFLFFYLSG